MFHILENTIVGNEATATQLVAEVPAPISVISQPKATEPQPGTASESEADQDVALWESDDTFNCEEGRKRLLDWMNANPTVAKTSREFCIDVVFGYDVFKTLGTGGRSRQHQVKDALDMLAGKQGGASDLSGAAINRMRIGDRVFFQAMEGRVITSGKETGR